MSTDTTALIVVQSMVVNDPRVRRQIDWLTDAGWTVDTLGLGPHPTDAVRNHFSLMDQPGWVKSRPGAAAIYTLLPNASKFRVLTANRIPRGARNLIASGEYSLVVFNDRELIPLVGMKKIFTARALKAHIHLDLHEYFIPQLERDSAWKVLTSSYYQWVRRFLSHPAFTSRSTVARGIAELYAKELGMDSIPVIRNSPPYVSQSPTPVDPAAIKLIHHGLASWERGLREIVDAMRLVDDRFSMTFMLATDHKVIAELAEYSSGVDNVRIVPPVSMRDLSGAVNHYDLEVMFYRPASRNLELALPNKLFEAVQGRLGLVIGESPMMADIVREYGNGVIVTGWDPKDLAAAINALTPEAVQEMKTASDRAARDLSAESEGAVFLQTVGIAHAGRPGTPA